MIVVVVFGILVGAAAGPVAADHPEDDDETDEDEHPMDVDLNDCDSGGDGTDNNTIKLGIIVY